MRTRMNVNSIVGVQYICDIHMLCQTRSSQHTGWCQALYDYYTIVNKDKNKHNYAQTSISRLHVHVYVRICMNDETNDMLGLLTETVTVDQCIMNPLVPVSWG